MPPNDAIDRVVAALRTVPEKRLLIVELAWELVGPGGRIDPDRASAQQPRINLALAECDVYSKATASAIRALQEVRPC